MAPHISFLWHPRLQGTDEFTTPLSYYGYRSTAIQPRCRDEDSIRRIKEVNPTHPLRDSDQGTTARASALTSVVSTIEASLNKHAFHVDVRTLTKEACSALMKEFKQDGKAVIEFLHGLPQSELCALKEELKEHGPKVLSIGGVATTLQPEHVALQSQPGQLGWVQVRNGWLTAAGAPGRSAFQNWYNEGATCVASLLRETEPLYESARSGCKERGFRWEHFPLSGKTAGYAPDGEDIQSWKKVSEMVPKMLDEGEHIVVHCAAGMHRTGCALFRSLRLCGLSAEEALDTIQTVRPVTHGALLEETRKWPGPLWAATERALNE